LFFRRETFADFTFFAMADLFCGTETLAHAAKFGKAGSRVCKGLIGCRRIGAGVLST
jgi:hypothetical protein